MEAVLAKGKTEDNEKRKDAFLRYKQNRKRNGGEKRIVAFVLESGS